MSAKEPQQQRGLGEGRVALLHETFGLLGFLFEARNRLIRWWLGLAGVVVVDSVAWASRSRLIRWLVDSVVPVSADLSSSLFRRGGG
uniref:Uncharacterized protein n=1 Tax=Fagus sylvatica TaxID=28930 RepID=A0A2N9IH19_FAGSY